MSRWLLALLLAVMLPFAAAAVADGGAAPLPALAETVGAVADIGQCEAGSTADPAADLDAMHEGSLPHAPGGAVSAGLPTFCTRGLAPPFVERPRRPPR